MPKIRYEEKNFRAERLDLLQKVNQIVREYRAMGYRLTLRQVYYQFVSRDWFPVDWADPITGSTNNMKSYGKLQDLISDGRLAGVIDWESIEDRTRELGKNVHWASPRDIIGDCVQWYMRDRWEGQEYRVQVWVEKDALEGVVSKTARELDVPFLSCRGYASQSIMWELAYKIMRADAAKGITPVILHLGDHDPSGVDMSRDIEDRVRMFMNVDKAYGKMLKFKRIALNMPQVRQYRPPENPAKSTDSRCRGYVAEYGEHCWELDALDPRVIDKLIRDEVLKFRDGPEHDRALRQEALDKEVLERVNEKWDEVLAILRNDD